LWQSTSAGCNGYLISIWDSDDNYAKADSIQWCWRKSGILSPTVETDMNNDIGSASVPRKKKRISSEDCLELCQLLSALTTKTEYMGTELPPALRESFVEEQNSSMEELEKWPRFGSV
jgi:hypothetical protein